MSEFPKRFFIHLVLVDNSAQDAIMETILMAIIHESFLKPNAQPTICIRLVCSVENYSSFHVRYIAYVILW